MENNLQISNSKSGQSGLKSLMTKFGAWLKTLAISKFILFYFKKFDRKVDGAISFFIKNYGKTKFMMAMSKKAQVLGIEKLWNKGPKAFIYFFLFYLIRDTILYIIIPIYLAKATTNG